MSETKQRYKRPITNRTKCRLVAMKKKLNLLKKTYPLYHDSELIKNLRLQLEPEMERELTIKMSEAPKNAMSQATKRWDLLFELMEGNGVIINHLWELLVLKNIGNKDLKTPLLEEYRRDVKKKCQRDLEHLRLSSRGNNDVANYLLQRLEEYQFDMSSISTELDQIDQYMAQIWNDIGKQQHEVTMLPETEDIEKLIRAFGDVLQEMASGIRQMKESNEDKEKIQDLETTIQELQMQLEEEQYKRSVEQRYTAMAKDHSSRLDKEKLMLEEVNRELMEHNDQLHTERQRDETKMQKKDEKIKTQQDHINQLTSANKASRQENTDLKLEVQDMGKHYKQAMDGMKEYFEEAVSQLKETSEREVECTLKRVEKQAKFITEKAVRDVKNAINDNHQCGCQHGINVDEYHPKTVHHVNMTFSGK